MALGKSIATRKGAPATYWMIGAVQEDFKGKGTEVTLYGYYDQATRQDPEAETLDVRVVGFRGEQYEAGMDRARIYGRIVAEVEEFAGATEA